MNIAILLAAGTSTRAGQNKLWADIFGKPLWTLAHDALHDHPQIDRIILMVPKGEELRFLPFVKDEKTQIVTGGTTRMDSFKRGLATVGKLSAADIIIDQNAANPNVTATEISAVISAAKKHGAAAVCHELVDTLVEVGEGIAEKPTAKNRANFRLMQTPQAVRGDIMNAATLHDSTDLSTALFSSTHVELLPASLRNKKITFAEDLASLRAQTFLGEDSHRFSEAGQLTLGGLTIPELPKLEASSDGDVILHAIGRALAQATGQNFSELADPLSLSGDQDSRDYLDPLLENCTVCHVSISIEGARPRIDPLIPGLKKSLAEILQVAESVITISAHSGEDLTPFGRGEGLSCTALVQVLN